MRNKGQFYLGIIIVIFCVVLLITNIFNINGFIPSGINPDTGLVEILELSNHPWFIRVQFHPELKSTILNPHPLFVSFIKASMEFKVNKLKAAEAEAASQAAASSRPVHGSRPGRCSSR